MQYALLAYGRHSAEDEIDAVTRTILERPPVTGWVRLHPDESATTVAGRDERILITDGPFIDSKEYLAGIILIEAENLDGALAVAREFQQARVGGAIEVRPVLGSTLGGA